MRIYYLEFNGINLLDKLFCGQRPQKLQTKLQPVDRNKLIDPVKNGPIIHIGQWRILSGINYPIFKKGLMGKQADTRANRHK